jgi:hypothetical protein
MIESLAEIAVFLAQRAHIEIVSVKLEPPLSTPFLNSDYGIVVRMLINEKGPSHSFEAVEMYLRFPFPDGRSRHRSSASIAIRTIIAGSSYLKKASRRNKYRQRFPGGSFATIS